MSERERAAFEQRYSSCDLTRDQYDGYLDHTIAERWEGWQAALADRPEPCAMCRGIGSHGEPPMWCRWCKGTGKSLAAPVARPEPAQPVAQDSVPMWPIARVLSRDGKIVEAEYYSPSLPDDVWHDLYPAPQPHPAPSEAAPERQEKCSIAKNPRYCWNVRCQLSKTCIRAAQPAKGDATS